MISRLRTAHPPAPENRSVKTAAQFNFVFVVDSLLANQPDHLTGSTHALNQYPQEEPYRPSRRSVPLRIRKSH